MNPQTQAMRRVGQAGESTDTDDETGGAGRVVNPQTHATSRVGQARW